MQGDDYNLDGRHHGILQDVTNGKITTVYKSKDDIDQETGEPLTKTCTYDNLQDFISAHPLDSAINPTPTRKMGEPARRVH